jgi:large conductance mechanosensitive channel
MSFLKEFKLFVLRGNVVDMAVGIIIGASFGKIISSLVNDVLMPPIGAVLGRVDFSSLAVTIIPSSSDHAAVVIKYGIFVNTLIDFLIVAAAMFFVIHLMNRVVKKQATVEPAPTMKDCPECLMSIPINAKRCGHCSSVVS